MYNPKINKEKLAYCGAHLANNKLKLILAESMTAGSLGLTFSLEKQSGDYFLGSIVCYHDDMKIQSLQIDKDLLNSYGGVSAEVTRVLAKNVKDNYQADLAIAVTGFAFDCKETSVEKPVGTVFMEICFANRSVSKKLHFAGAAEEIIAAANAAIIDELYEILKNNEWTEI